MPIVNHIDMKLGYPACFSALSLIIWSCPLLELSAKFKQEKARRDQMWYMLFGQAVYARQYYSFIVKGEVYFGFVLLLLLIR